MYICNNMYIYIYKLYKLWKQGKETMCPPSGL